MHSDDRYMAGEMKVVLHQIYEFKKGVRSLVLCTLCSTCAEMIMERLEKQDIKFLIQQVHSNKVNLFFGKQACLDAVCGFIHKPLNQLTPEEDFMLGAMLGYDISQQCERYCSRKSQYTASA